MLKKFMMQDEWENKLTDQDQNMLVKNILPDHAKLTEYLRILFPMTGIIDKLFCNEFMLESLKLLKHGIFLYENGFFDCAFYSVRQSIENMNNMLFLSQCKERFAKWKAKEWFPSDSRVKSQLKQINVAYSEVKTIIPEVFDLYDELLEKANKYIHKQGFDTFYLSPWQHKRLMPKITELFTKFFKQSILLMIIMNIILDPLSLALSDPDIDARIPFDPLTENIPVSILEELFNQDIVEKIKKATFYKEFISCFMDKEKMNEFMNNVVPMCQEKGLTDMKDAETFWDMKHDPTVKGSDNMILNAIKESKKQDTTDFSAKANKEYNDTLLMKSNQNQEVATNARKLIDKASKLRYHNN